VGGGPFFQREALMAKAKIVDDVEVEALLRFPWKGKPIFAGQRFSVSRDEARALADDKIALIPSQEANHGKR
jgi:hypothetical protein